MSPDDEEVVVDDDEVEVVVEAEEGVSASMVDEGGACRGTLNTWPGHTLSLAHRELVRRSSSTVTSYLRASPTRVSSGRTSCTA